MPDSTPRYLVAAGPDGRYSVEETMSPNSFATREEAEEWELANIRPDLIRSDEWVRLQDLLSH